MGPAADGASLELSGRRAQRSEPAVALEGVQLSHPERVLWPGEGITKLELAHYYLAMAEPLLRFVRDRPLTLRPFPRGVGGPSFWVQDAPAHTPEFVQTWRWIPAATGRPIERRYAFEEVRAFVHRLGREMARRAADVVTTDLALAKRDRLVYFDYAQNGEGKTLAAPYSVRPKPGAPVSAPLRWEELDDSKLRPDGWSIHDMPERVRALGDLMAPAYGLRQRLPE